MNQAIYGKQSLVIALPSIVERRRLCLKEPLPRVPRQKTARPTTKYTYDYDHLPPLAMVGAVTEAEAFSARPDWIHLVARSALKILINSIMIGVKNKGGQYRIRSTSAQKYSGRRSATERRSWA